MRHATGSMGTSGKGKLFRNSYGFFLSSKMISVRNDFERGWSICALNKIVLIIFSSMVLEVNSMCSLLLQTARQKRVLVLG
jgi:hypothetical protein